MNSLKYLNFIRGQFCIVGNDCWGRVVPHHLWSLGSAGGKYIEEHACHFTAVPMCVLHHGMIHDKGVRQFRAITDVDPWEWAYRLYEKFEGFDVPSIPGDGWREMLRAAVENDHGVLMTYKP